MSDTNEARVSFSIGLDDGEVADDLQNWLTENGATELSREMRKGILPIIPIVIGGSIAAAAIAQLVIRIRDNYECQQLFDFRSNGIKHVVDCRFKNGKILIIADKDQQVEITEAPDILDFTEIAKTAATAGADAAKAAVEAAGGKAGVTKTEGTPTTAEL